MKILPKTKWLSAALLPIIVACSNGAQDQLVSQDLSGLETISIPATSQLGITDQAKKITFVANTTAQWLGHIVYLTESGEVFATNSEGVSPRKVTPDTLVDIYGITRDQAPGIIFGLTVEGQIKAYIEASDDGSVFDPMIVSAPTDTEIAGFCPGSSPILGNKAWLRLKSGELATYTVEIIDDKSVSIEISDPVRSRAEALTCGAVSGVSAYIGTASGMQTLQSNGDSQKYDWPVISAPTSITPIITGMARGTDQAVAVAEDEAFKIQITDGLSITGSPSLSALAATSQSFGSTFGNGMIVASDNNEPRLILIAAPMFERQVDAAINK